MPIVETGDTRIRDELLNDPVGVVYPIDDEASADKLNEVGARSSTRTRLFATGDQLQSQVIASEFESLTASQQRLWQAIISAANSGSLPAQGVRIDDAAMRAQIAGIWGVTTTGTNLVALQDRPASRIEIILDEDGVVAHSWDVARARRV